ncbi:hypothetical protein [Mediterraneibacter massiliensis]|nr:hypothetical protein [Mediterraneibacter massiliensis]
MIAALIAVGVVFDAAGVKDVLLELFIGWHISYYTLNENKEAMK